HSAPTTHRKTPIATGRALSDGIWHFRHDEGFFGQLFQIVAGFAIWSVSLYIAVKLLVDTYEGGKGPKEEAEIIREADDEFSRTRMGSYRSAFCIRLAVTSGFVIEGLRFGGGWPTIFLLCLGVGSWYSLSPDRKWM